MLLEMDPEMQSAVAGNDMAAASYCLKVMRQIRTIYPLQARMDYIRIN